MRRRSASAQLKRAGLLTLANALTRAEIAHVVGTYNERLSLSVWGAEAGCNAIVQSRVAGTYVVTLTNGDGERTFDDVNDVVREVQRIL